MSRSRASSRLASREGSCEDLLALDNDAVIDDSPSSDQGSEGLSASAGGGSATSGQREHSHHHKVRLIFDLCWPLVTKMLLT